MSIDTNLRSNTWKNCCLVSISCLTAFGIGNYWSILNKTTIDTKDKTLLFFVFGLCKRCSFIFDMHRNLQFPPPPTPQKRILKRLRKKSWNACACACVRAKILFKRFSIWIEDCAKFKYLISAFFKRTLNKLIRI